MKEWRGIIKEVDAPIRYASLLLLGIVYIITIAIVIMELSETILLMILLILCVNSTIIFILLIKQKKVVKNKKMDEKIDIESDIKSYENIHKTYPDMGEIINKSIKSGRETEIAVLGLTLYHMWEYLKNFLKKSSTKNMNILFCLVDSSSPNIKGLDNNWAKLSDDYVEDIQRYRQVNRDVLAKRKIKIEINRYCHIPMIHGILINKKDLFLSYTQWDWQDRMEGAENFYVYYYSESNTGKLHVEMFNNWIEHIKRGKCKELCLKYTVQTNSVGDRK